MWALIFFSIIHQRKDEISPDQRGKSPYIIIKYKEMKND